MRSVETEILQMTSDATSSREMTSGVTGVTSGVTGVTSGGTGVISGSNEMTSRGSGMTSVDTEMVLEKTSTRTEEARSIIASVDNIDD